MSPSFVNTNSHPVRVDRPSPTPGRPSKLVRLRPGQVVEAEGEYADSLAATPGVENATEEQAKVHEASVAQHRREGEMPGLGTRLGEKLALGPARVALRRAIHAPLRRVVGDDAAPLGPPSGETSSKAQEAVKDDAHRRAFADHERLPGERVRGAGAPPLLIPASADPRSGEIENAQARNAEQAERLLEDLAEAGRDVLESEPWTADPPVEESTTPGSGGDEEWVDEDSEDGSEGGDESQPVEPETPADESEQPADEPAAEREVGQSNEPNLTDDGYPAEPYDLHNQDALAAELARRGLGRSGTKAEQIARLRAADGTAPSTSE